MEREAFLRGMDFLIAKQLDVAEIVTDASSSIQKTLGTISICLTCIHIHMCICRNQVFSSTPFSRCMAQKQEAKKGTGRGKTPLMFYY